MYKKKIGGVFVGKEYRELLNDITNDKNIKQNYKLFYE